MPTLAEIQDQIDQFVSDRLQTIRNRQESYRVVHRRYWQGLATHAVCPMHTDAVDDSKTADRLSSRPTDQIERWQDVLPEWTNELLPACVRIDVYDGPSGHGWVLIVEASHNDVVYNRTQNIGPETYRTNDWRVEEAENELTRRSR